MLQLQLTQYLPDKQGEYLIGKKFSFSQITGMYPDEFLLLICVNMCHLGAEDYACIYELNLLYQQNFGYLLLYFASYAQFSFLDHPGMFHGLT